ncbi:MAG: Nif3-like dinuclear metal center hexameric protein [Oscillospiraceae bacterium]|nr:Nif3-like dinuclear metal center hexameric protein [Oscillospiraceae bacterium]
MTVGDILAYIDSFAPFCSQSSWDNSGLILGCTQNEVKKALICLDVTRASVENAVKNGCDLIISHHPVIFKAIKSISSSSVYWTLIKNGINVISAHTNLDKAINGVNDTLCDVLEMDYSKLPEEYGEGYMNAGVIKNISSAHQLAQYTAKKLNAAVRFIDAGEPIEKIAVCSGSGGHFYADAKAAGCTALITGDADHHDFLDAASAGVSLIAAGHFETEVPVTDTLFNLLTEKFLNAEFILQPKFNSILTVI